MLETLRDRLQDSHEVPVNEALGAFGSRPLEIAKQCGLLDDLERGGSGGVRVERRRGHLPEGVPRVVAVRVADPSTPFPRSA
jgi:hypothetical protein